MFFTDNTSDILDYLRDTTPVWKTKIRHLPYTSENNDIDATPSKAPENWISCPCEKCNPYFM